MATFGQLRAEIARLLRKTNNGTDDAVIEQAIQDAIDFHKTRRLDFTDGTDTFFTTIGTPDYVLPTDFLAITEAVSFQTGSNFRVMSKRDWNWYLKANSSPNVIRSTPADCYAIRDKRIYFYPTPSGAFQIDLYYIKKLAELDNDDDQNEWTNEARLLIRSRALYDLYLNKAQQPDFASTQLQFEKDALELLTRPAALNLGRQHLTPAEF